MSGLLQLDCYDNYLLHGWRIRIRFGLRIQAKGKRLVTGGQGSRSTHEVGKWKYGYWD